MTPAAAPLTPASPLIPLLFLFFCIDVIFPVFFSHVELFSFGEKSTVFPSGEAVPFLGEFRARGTLEGVDSGYDDTLEIVFVGFEDELAKQIELVRI